MQESNSHFLKNQIIQTLFTGKNFSDFILKIEPAHLRDDLKQETALIICEMTDEKVIGLDERKELSFYVVRMVFNMISNKYHPFHKKYRSVNLEFKEMCHDPLIDAKDLNDEFEFKYALKRGHEFEPGDESLAFNVSERSQLEELEDFTLGEIENLYWFDRDMVKLYLEVKTYRAMFERTGIPFPTCYKNIQKTIQILRKKATAPKSIFTNREIKFLKTGDDEI